MSSKNINIVIFRREKLGHESCTGLKLALENLGHKVFICKTYDQDDIKFVETLSPEMIIRWGCTVSMETDIPVINPVKAMNKISNKAEFRTLLGNDPLLKDFIPKTITDTQFYSGQKTLTDDFFPAIVRPYTHHGGFQLQYIKSLTEFQNTKLPSQWYISIYIPKVKEIRVYCMGGHVLKMDNKVVENKDAVAWNYVQNSDAHFVNIRWDAWHKRCGRIALQAMKLVGLDFGGVDIMIDAENNDYILEINSAPTITGEYEQKIFSLGFDYLLQHIRKTGEKYYNMEIPEKCKSYRELIHPALLKNKE
jgi:glutathione synthase/RimK-type ligase-like ATP-grasp enzyme